jgi:hypothetical protein
MQLQDTMTSISIHLLSLCPGFTAYNIPGCLGKIVNLCNKHPGLADQDADLLISSRSLGFGFCRRSALTCSDEPHSPLLLLSFCSCSPPLSQLHSLLSIRVICIITGITTCLVKAVSAEAALLTS